MKGLLKTIALVRMLARWERVPTYTTIAERDTYAPTQSGTQSVSLAGSEGWLWWKKDYVYVRGSTKRLSRKPSKSRCMLLQ